MLISLCLIKFPAENNEQQEYVFDPDHTMRNMVSKKMEFYINKATRVLNHRNKQRSGSRLVFHFALNSFVASASRLLMLSRATIYRF